MADSNAVRTFWRRGAVAGAGALAVNLAVLAIARLADVSLTVPAWDGDSTTTVGIGAVVVSSVLPFAAALVATRLLALRSRRAARRLAVVAGLVILASFAPPLTLEAAASTRAVLALMHVPVAAAYAAVLMPLVTGRDTKAPASAGEATRGAGSDLATNSG